MSSIAHYGRFLIANLMGVIALGAAASAIYSFIELKSEDWKILTTRPENQIVKKLEDTIARIEKKQSELESQISIAGQLAEKFDRLPSDAQGRALIAGFDERIGTIHQRLKTIEDLIIQDPHKSLSMVILKRDVDSLQKTLDDKAAAQNASIERLYNIFGWSIGALIIAVIANIVSNYFGPGSKKTR